MPDPQPNPAMTDTEAARIAMLQTVKPAWVTAALAIVNTSVWAYSGYAAIVGIWPIWLSFLVSTAAIYVNYTPHHEAIHGNIAGANRKLTWLNDAIGTMTGLIFFHGFTMHRITHLTHHAYTNDPVKDPDHWAHGKLSWLVVIRCLSILVPHEIFGWRIALKAANGRVTMARSVVEHSISYGGMLILIFTGHWDAAVFAFILPAILSSGILGFTFDWLVHHPHQNPVTDRYRTSNVYLFPRPLHWVLTVLYIWQNYHIIHHLYPRVPFYRYTGTFDQIRPLLIARGTCITVFSWRRDRSFLWSQTIENPPGQYDVQPSAKAA